MAVAQSEGTRADVSAAPTPAVAALAWTPKLIAERLAEAADVLALLPEEQPRGLYDLWPRIVGGPCTGTARPAAAPEAIDRMDETLAWLGWLDPGERRLVWLRAEGMPWKWITRRLGVGRTTAWQRWTIALLKIATRLNASAEQGRSNIKPLNKWGDSVIESRQPQTRSGRRARPHE
jgi:hypothetical protein